MLRMSLSGDDLQNPRRVVSWRSYQPHKEHLTLWLALGRGSEILGRFGEQPRSRSALAPSRPPLKTAGNLRFAPRRGLGTQIVRRPTGVAVETQERNSLGLRMACVPGGVDGVVGARMGSPFYEAAVRLCFASTPLLRT
jgi:hypothetical protein